MQKNYLSLLLLLLVVTWGCKDKEEVATTGIVKGTVTDALSSDALDEAHLIIVESNSNTPVSSVTTLSDGSFTAELEPGSYYLKVYRQGYEQVPPRNISPVSFTITTGEELDNPVEMFTSEITNGGMILGKVSEGGIGIPGALVVGEKDGVGYSTISDAEGNFYLFNLPSGSFNIKGWIAGYESNQSMVSVTSSSETQQDITLTKGASGSVNGTISFLASTAVEIDVALTHPLTHEAIPGLINSTSSSYTIAQVPAGEYLARATYKNDERVVDPDWIVKFGEPMVQVSGNQVTRDFSVTGALQVVGPTNLAINTIPNEITSTTPDFSWEPYPSASDYVIEVSDASGNIIWGGIDMTQSIPVKNVIVPGSQTTISFNADGSATRNLEPGKIYRWKVYVSKDDKQSDAGWRLISVSEDQLGLIKIAK